MSTKRRLPFSTPNVIAISASTVCAVVSAIFGNIPGTALLGLIAVGFLISALLARRASAGDWLRVNALEYRDERDAMLGRRGFAIVGAWALGLSLLELIVCTLAIGAINFRTETQFDGHSFSVTSNTTLGALLALEVLAAMQVFVLNIIWGMANTRAVRRG